jgi:hypothetical protein
MHTACHHLFAALKQDYKAVTTNWEGMLFCISLNWDYQARLVNLLMLGYVEKVLKEFQHIEPTQAEHQPHRNNETQNGVKLQLTDPLDTTAPLSAAQNTLQQKITGNFYIRHVLWILLCWSPSAHSHRSRPMVPNALWMTPSSF